MRLREDGTVAVQVAAELAALIVPNSTHSANLTALPAGVPVPVPRRVPQQARLRMYASATGPTLPASFGLVLENDGAAAAAAAAARPAGAAAGLAQLRLAVAVEKGSACVFLGSPRQGCAPIAAPRISAGAGPSTSWALDATVEVWLDNGLVEVFVGSAGSSAGSGSSQAVLSAFYPKLFNATAGLSGSVWSESNATAAAALEWSAVASANFTESLVLHPSTTP